MLYHSKAKLEARRKKRIAARFDLSGRPTTEEKVRRLLREESQWATILRACLIAAEQKHAGQKREGQFAGAWVMQILRAEGVTPPSNLRTLTSVGLLNLVVTTRSGNRAYYAIPDPKGIARALKNR